MAFTAEKIRKDALRRNYKDLTLISEVFIDVANDQNSVSVSYADVIGSIIEIDFSKWLAYKMYIEVDGHISVAGTGYIQLYNITDSQALSGSELTFTNTSEDRVRSSEITAKPKTGIKEIKLQTKVSVGTIYLSKVRIVFAQ